MVAVSLQPVLGAAETDRLAGTRFTDVRWVDSTASTNADLIEEARAGAAEGVVLVADHQTAGRGRLGRTWEAAPGSSLLVSVLLRPSLDVDDAHLVTMAAGLAAADACASVAGVTPGLKWPNDLLVGERKLAGLLAESLVAGDRVAAVVVGMGLNVSSAPEGGAALGEGVDRAALLVDWLLGYDERLDHLDSLLDDYLARCVTVGRRVRVELPGRVVEVTATGVDPAGHLLLDDGTVVSAGDVVHVRPAD